MTGDRMKAGGMERWERGQGSFGGAPACTAGAPGLGLAVWPMPMRRQSTCPGPGHE